MYVGRSNANVRSETPFSRKKYHIVTSQLICIANELVGFHITQVSTKKCFWNKQLNNSNFTFLECSVVWFSLKRAPQLFFYGYRSYNLFRLFWNHFSEQDHVLFLLNVWTNRSYCLDHYDFSFFHLIVVHLFTNVILITLFSTTKGVIYSTMLLFKWCGILDIFKLRW